MDLYLLLKLVHVGLAILWVGGVSILTLLVVTLLRRGDDTATMTGISYVALLGNRVFAPVGALTILSGLTLGWLGGWFWAAWTVLAILVVAGAFALGALHLGPTSERAARTFEGGDLPGAMILGRKVLRLIALDLSGQWAIIALMVLKPAWTDPALAIPAALLATGALLALRQPSPATSGPAVPGPAIPGPATSGQAA